MAGTGQGTTRWGECELVLSRHAVNLMLVGSQEATAAEVDRFRRWLVTPQHTCEFPGPLCLPRGHGGGLRLRNAGALSHEQQRQLLDWLQQDRGRTQIISEADASLIAHVQRGDFSEQLYYQLNTVLKECRGDSISEVDDQIQLP